MAQKGTPAKFPKSTPQRRLVVGEHAVLRRGAWLVRPAWVPVSPSAFPSLPRHDSGKAALQAKEPPSSSRPGAAFLPLLKSAGPQADLKLINF